MPPTGTHCPPATFSLIRSNSSGSRSRTHSYCCAWEHDEHVVGSPVHQVDRRRERADALAHRLADRPQPGRVDVRVPGGDDTVAAGRGRRRQLRSEHRRVRRRGRRPVRDGVERAGERAQQARPAVVARSASSRMTPSRTFMSCNNASASWSTSTRSARSNRYSSLSPAVDSEPRGDGWNCGNIGFDAASTISSTEPLDDVDGHGLAPRMDALDRAAVRIADERLALESRRVGVEADVDDRLDATAGPRRRRGAAEPEPRRAPRRAPLAAHLERRQLVERRSRFDRHRQPLGMHERENPVVQLAGDPLLDQLPVIVHPSNVPPVRDSDRG